MKYSADMYQEFLERLLKLVLEEHAKIGREAEEWKNSFRIITPDFKKKLFWRRKKKRQKIGL